MNAVATLERLAAKSLMAGGLLFALFMWFHPANDLEGAKQWSLWVPVHVTWLISYLLLLLGLPGLFLRLSQTGVGKSGMLSLLLFIGMALSITIATFDSFIVPTLAIHQPDLIEAIEETSTELPSLMFRGVFLLNLLIFSLSHIWLGIAITVKPGFPKGAGIMIGIGAPLFWLGAFIFSHGGPMENLVTALGALLYGLGMGRLGCSFCRA